MLPVYSEIISAFHIYYQSFGLSTYWIQPQRAAIPSGCVRNCFYLENFNDAFLFLQQNEIIKVHWWWGDIYSFLPSCEILKKVKCSGFLLSVEDFICLQGMTGHVSSHIPGSAALRCPASLSSKVVLISTFARACSFAFPDVFWVTCKQHPNTWNYVANTSVWYTRSKPKKGQTIQHEDA